MQVQLSEGKLEDPNPTKLGTHQGNMFVVSVYQMTCTISKHLGPLSEVGTLCNIPAPGIQTAFEIIFHSCPELPCSRGPFYIWHPVAQPALPCHPHWHSKAGMLGGEDAGSPPRQPGRDPRGGRGRPQVGRAGCPHTHSARWDAVAAQERQSGR